MSQDSVDNSIEATKSVGDNVDGAVGGELGAGQPCVVRSREASLISLGRFRDGGEPGISQALEAWTDLMHLSSTVGDFVFRKKIEEVVRTKKRGMLGNEESNESNHPSKQKRIAPPPLFNATSNSLHSGTSPQNPCRNDAEQGDRTLAEDVEKIRQMASLLVRVKAAHASFKEEILALINEK